MPNGETILLLSGFLFCFGIIGILRQSNMVKIMISIEIMIFASVINFCYFAGGESIKFGHFAAMIAVVFGGIVLSIVYAIFNVEAKRNVKVNLYL